MPDRAFIIVGKIQFDIQGGATLIPVQDVTPGQVARAFLPLEPSETVLEAVTGDPSANWGNADIMAVAQTLLAMRFPGDTCQLYTPKQWARKLDGTGSVPQANAADDELRVIAEAIKVKAARAAAGDV